MILYPCQTSLIPATVALLRFFLEQGFSAFTQNYPYWYFGSTPYRYLIGPVLPFLVSIFLKLIPNVSLFNILIYLIIVSFLLSAIGWTLLALRVLNYDLNKGRFKYYLLSAAVFLLFWLFPGKYLSAFGLEEGTVIVARNILPWILLSFWQVLKTRKLSYSIIVITSTSFLLLTNTSLLPQLLVGVLSLILALSYKDGRFKEVSAKLKLSFSLLAFSWLLVTLWYTPNYWLTILFNPSIGGVSLIRVVARVLDLFKAIVPLVLAVGAVFFSRKIKSRSGILASVWLKPASFKVAIKLSFGCVVIFY